MTVREAAKVLTSAELFIIIHGGCEVTRFPSGNTFMLDALGDYVVGGIHAVSVDEDAYELELDMRPYKEA